MTRDPTVHLKPGKEGPILRRHPWIFSGAVEHTEEAQDGDTVTVRASDGSFVARGYLNARSQIAVRVWTLDDEPPDGDFLARRLDRAIQVRAAHGLRYGASDGPTNGFRLVNAEADLLPGLIVDVYGRHLVLQALTLGVDRRKTELAEILARRLRPDGIYERSDVDVRAKEGLPPSTGCLYGAEPPPLLEVLENGHRFCVDLRAGQKTGFYLDQRDNRQRASDVLAMLARTSPSGGALRILNAFSYSGAFGVYLCRACPEARVLNLDASAVALDLARENFERTGVALRGEYAIGDAFAILRRLRDSRQSFDAIVMDPPKFAHAKDQVDPACRGYKDLNLLAIKLLRPRGALFSFSCSGLVPAPLFQRVLGQAALDAGRPALHLATLGHGPDHPLLLSFPEGEYLKGCVLYFPD
jgi:23S rRNA (cytosine1962-C5)-methyltransferase